jgi:hypothetical protein
MILSAMMFALGFLVSGLVWLAFSVALVRRARRLTERRLLASIATRRAEFEAERDELRARHAVEMHRLERQVARILDQATAHRLDADVKERDLLAMKAEIEAREEDFHDLQQRLSEERDLVQDLERRHAEAGSALRQTQHALEQERRRREMAEEALDEAGVFTDQRRFELSALRAENEALKAMLTERLPDAVPPLSAPQPVPFPVAVPAAAAAAAPGEAPQGASVVPLPMRPKPAEAGDGADKAAEQMAEAARDLQRLAGEARADLGQNVWRGTAQPEPRLPSATELAGAGVLAELDTRRAATTNGAGNGTGEAGKPEASADPNAETRFFEALAEIRALKRAASQAGE